MERGNSVKVESGSACEPMKVNLRGEGEKTSTVREPCAGVYAGLNPLTSQ